MSVSRCVLGLEVPNDFHVFGAGMSVTMSDDEQLEMSGVGRIGRGPPAQDERRRRVTS